MSRTMGIPLLTLFVLLVGCSQPTPHREPSPAALTVTTLSLQTAVLGSPYTATLTAVGGVSELYSWSLDSGDLPGGMTLSPAGLLSGTPSQTGYFSFETEVSEGGLRGKKTLSLLVEDAAGWTVPTLDVAARTICGATVAMEFSLDDQGSWKTCTGGVEPVDLVVGSRVWVRVVDQPGQIWFLGTVAALTGPDLTPGPDLHPGLSFAETNVWVDGSAGLAGDTLFLAGTFLNRGTSSFSSSDLSVKVYLSADRNITAADTEVADLSGSFGGPPGTIALPWPAPFTVPNVTPGVYYLGILLDGGDTLPEANEDNNASSASDVVPFLVKDPTVNLGGAFKFVNSWGDDGSGWENLADGHYWVTYDAMIALKMPVFFTFANFASVHKPTVLAVFRLTHPLRNQCRVTLGLGDPGSPLLTKEFQALWGSDLKGGALPFPDNALVLDITEFATYINSSNLFLQVENSSDTAGTVDSFSVEYHRSSDLELLHTVTATPAGLPAASSVVLTAATAGALTSSQLALVQPPALTLSPGLSLTVSKPLLSEQVRDQRVIGVARPGVSYNEVFRGHGTGLIPPSSAEWSSLRRLTSVQSLSATAVANTGIDLSKTPWFPPVGDQGGQGSCVAWSMGYYVHTYSMARQQGWDLTSAVYGGPGSGAPLSNQARIMSPAFIYNQINNGLDQGSSYQTAADLLIRMGDSSWATAPYDEGEFTRWPSEAAYREAAGHRALKVGNPYWTFSQGGYLIVENQSDINLLKTLVQSGYCLTAGIRAGDRTQDDNLFYYLGSRDVVSATTFSAAALGGTNHAQTIVGFKDGTAWNPLTPDL